MRKVRDFLDSFIIEFDWKDIVVFEVCLCAFGIAVGSSLPAKNKKPVIIVSLVAFFVTVSWLCLRLFGFDELCGCDDDWDDFEDYFEDEEDLDEAEESEGLVVRITTEE